MSNSPPTIPFAEVEKLRLFYNFTQQDFVALLGYAPPSYSGWKKQGYVQKRVFAHIKSALVNVQPNTTKILPSPQTQYHTYNFDDFALGETRHIPTASPKSVINAASNFFRRTGKKFSCKSSPNSVQVTRIK